MIKSRIQGKIGIHRIRPAQIEPAANSQGSSAQGNDAVIVPIFMPEHPINTTRGPSPILTPFKFLYLLGNQHNKKR